MDWQTPDSFLDLVRQVAPIALDPCTSAENPTGARRYVSPDANILSDYGPFGPQLVFGAVGRDGLAEPWHAWTEGHGLAYVNPPYGRALGAWAAKIVTEARLGAEIIALVPARTDTKWFHLMAEHMTSLLLWKGRLTFKGAPAPAPFPSAVFYFGRNWDRFHDLFESWGFYVHRGA